MLYLERQFLISEEKVCSVKRSSWKPTSGLQEDRPCALGLFSNLPSFYRICTVIHSVLVPTLCDYFHKNTMLQSA